MLEPYRPTTNRKRIKYKKDVESCKMLTEKNEAFEEAKISIKKKRQDLKEEHRQEIDLLNEYIEKLNKLKEELSTDPISVEAADKRLAELRIQ